MTSAKALLLAFLLAAASFHVAPAKAETFNTCAGFIESLPATISTQGVWCLKKDLATAMTSGDAITIATNNVTIDCNGFKIGGLAAGASSGAWGIYAASSRQNVTVRNCAIRGFFYGMVLQGSGHLVEDNRLDQNLLMGIRVEGENNLVQRNAVYDTGGYPGNNQSIGIFASADVIDNTVAGVYSTATDSFNIGIFAPGNGLEVSGNRVRNVAATGASFTHGIQAGGIGVTLSDNRVSAEAATRGPGISAPQNAFCIGNTVVNFSIAYECSASDRNLSLPSL